MRFTCILLVVAGCSGDIDGGGSSSGDDVDPKTAKAIDSWIHDAIPALNSTTPACTTCHETGEMSAPTYLAGMTDLDRRDSIIAFVPSVISLKSPKISSLVLKGGHEGPALGADAISSLLRWIAFEGVANGDGTVIETGKTAIADCSIGNPDDPACMVTTIDLSSAGSAGSTITFQGQGLGADVIAFKITVTAGSAGLKMTHPRFKTYPSMGSDMDTGLPDANDTFYNIDLTLTAGAKMMLSTSSVTFPNFSSADPISVEFDALM
ncbi:MAG: hypothetical protein QM831_17520 [Kofleriaceae bacterium]